MSRYRVVIRYGGPPEDISAWCEDCDEQFEGNGRYGPSQAARRHTERTGHTTTADRSGASVWYRATPGGEEGTNHG